MKNDKTDDHRRKNIAHQLDKFSTQDLVAIYKIALEIDGDYLNGRLKKIATECGFNQEDLTNFMNQAIEKAITDPDFESIVREELIDALSVAAGRSEKSYHWFKGLDAAKFASLANSKKCTDEIDKQLGTYALNAQPGFKPPRLVK